MTGVVRSRRDLVRQELAIRCDKHFEAHHADIFEGACDSLRERLSLLSYSGINTRWHDCRCEDMVLVMVPDWIVWHDVAGFIPGDDDGDLTIEINRGF